MDKKYVYGTPENRAFLSSQADILLRFGRSFASPGGGSWYLGDDGTPWKDRPRETWITSRMVHSYALGALLGKEGCGELADAALSGLLGELFDRKNDGWYAGLTSSGDILPGKHCYAHAFVILAGCSGVISGRPDGKALLDKALDVYDRFFWDEKEGLARDTWNTEFTVCDPYRGLNANMHSVEAFLAVADVTGNETYRVRAGRIIDRVIGWAKDNGWRIPEHFTQDWQPDLDCNKDKPDDQFKPFGATPGHGIEWSRLIAQWAVSAFREDGGREPYLDAAANLFRRAVSDGWNADGAPGLVYTTDWEGQPVVHDRMHWTLAEAINTSATLLQLTGDTAYADDYAQFMQYLDEKVIDHKNGSWFHQLDRSNNVLDTVWPGKPDIYHALQAMLIPYVPVGVSIAAAVGK
ncbi:MAG: AGE family epimerase/isomerase [Lachnospiraceae bacterium]|nr:AGE family epimerase/isomerase [Lachnospiraceae bacterium]